MNVLRQQGFKFPEQAVMSEKKIFSNGHQVRKIKITAQWWTNYTRWFYNPDISIIPLEQKTYFMNCKVQLNMVAWQTDRGTLSWLSERGSCGTWERSSGSECVSECASAPSTQIQKFGHFCECNVNCKYVKYDFSTNEARNNCNTSFPCDFDWAIHFWYYFHDSSRSKGKFQSQTRNMCDLIPLFHTIWKSIYGIFMVIQSHIQGRKVNYKVFCV